MRTFKDKLAGPIVIITFLAVWDGLLKFNLLKKF
jgi:hypothetical protein